MTDDVERFHFNTALSALMELVNDAYRLKDSLYGDEAGSRISSFATATVASLLFPFAPHLGAEVYELVAGALSGRRPGPGRRAAAGA